VPNVSYGTSYHLVANPPGVTGHTVARPWVSVRLHNGPVSRRVWSLVDTGADDCVMDLGIAALLRIGLATLPTMSVNTAGGATSLSRCAGLTVEVAGRSVTADVLFGTVAVPLLGRSALLGLFAAGFDATHWHHT
jgi:predicted aspartyl protease